MTKFQMESKMVKLYLKRMKIILPKYLKYKLIEMLSHLKMKRMKMTRKFIESVKQKRIMICSVMHQVNFSLVLISLTYSILMPCHNNSVNNLKEMLTLNQMMILPSNTWLGTGLLILMMNLTMKVQQTSLEQQPNP